jgi:hypothetical protein
MKSESEKLETPPARGANRDSGTPQAGTEKILTR